jgi:chloramphenicol O-acetyltransferase type A
MKSPINPENWNRKEHFEFFKEFDEPFFGIVADVDCTEAHAWCRTHQVPFFHFYLYQSLRAANQIEEFRSRIEDDKPVLYDSVNASATISRADHTFGFSFIPFVEDFKKFSSNVTEEILAVGKTSGLRLNGETGRNDVIHYSVLPWFSFTGLSHARHFAYRDSVPKITFGKYFEKHDRILMPVSVNAHHGLMDAWHVSEFLRLFSEFLATP